MNLGALILPVAAGFAAWLLSRGRAEASDDAPQLPTDGDDTGDADGGDDEDASSGPGPDGETWTPPTSGPSSPSSPTVPSSPTAPPSSPSSPTAPTTAPGPQRRTAKQAAQDLYDYVKAAIDAGRAASLGSKGKPNQVVRDAEIDMGLTGDDANGVYGPKDRKRGKELLNKTFPVREDKPTTGPAPKPPKPAPSSSSSSTTTASSSSSSSSTTPPLRSEPVVLSEPPAPPEPRPKPAPKPPTSSPTPTPAPRPQPSSPTPTPAPKPPKPAPSSPTAPPKRSALQAAKDLYDYAKAAIDAGRAASLGNKNKPNEVVRQAQADMGLTGDDVDGVYGPTDRARGKELLNKTFPIRK